MTEVVAAFRRFANVPKNSARTLNSATLDVFCCINTIFWARVFLPVNAPIFLQYGLNINY